MIKTSSDYSDSLEYIDSLESSESSLTVRQKLPIKKKSPIKVKSSLDVVEEFNKYKNSSVIVELEKNIKKEQIKKGIYKHDTGNIYIQEHLKDLANRAKILNNKSKRGKYNVDKVKYLFVTLNPDDCTLVQLKNIINVIKYKYCIYSYVFEQRGDNIEHIGDGKHIHMILKKESTVSDMLRRLFSSLKKTNLFDDIQKIDIQKISDKDGVEHYMQGKKNPIKLPCYDITVMWRIRNKLKHIYVLREEISQYVAPLVIINDITATHITVGSDEYIVIVKDGNKKCIKID